MSEIKSFVIAPSVPGSGGRVETRRQLHTVIVAMLGITACVNTMLAATMGVFISAFHEVFGWSRADTSLAWTAYTIVVFLSTAMIGTVADRLDPGRLASMSMLAFGAALLLVPYTVHSVAALWVSYVVMAVVGAGTSPVVLTKPVIVAFTQNRGIAIGVALTGAGVGSFVLPLFANALIGLGSWKYAYLGLGGFAILVAPIIWHFLRRRSVASSLFTKSATEYPGATFREAIHSRVFWLLSAIALLGGFGMSVPAAHLIPFLRDQAVSASGAAFLASLLGLASILGRILTGITLDRVDRPLPGVLFFNVGALGVVLLVLCGAKWAAVAACLVGIVIGSEMDLLAYFASRYFGLRAHATVFGWNYGMVALGSATGPLVVGALRDRLGDYSVGLSLAAGGLAAAGFLCPLLGRYRYPAHIQGERGNSETNPTRMVVAHVANRP
jgi:MFS family permease